MHVDRFIFVNDTLRYPRPARPGDPELDGMKNFFHVTRAPENLPRVQLEKGINGVAVAGAAGQRRRPAVLVRSSPWKAGTTGTPWHDAFDLEAGRVTYFGDHKPETNGPLGSTSGNKLLEEVRALHRSDLQTDRLAAPPLIVFRAEPWRDTRGKLHEKGAVAFLGIALIERLSAVTNIDPDTGFDFPNYKADLRLMPLNGSPGRLDWTWINLRRRDIPLDEALQDAPDSWRRWVQTGRS